jgi:hypothetical protein
MPLGAELLEQTESKVVLSRADVWLDLVLLLLFVVMLLVPNEYVSWIMIPWAILFGIGFVRTFRVVVAGNLSLLKRWRNRRHG